jgi:hypothetical protein
MSGLTQEADIVMDVFVLILFRQVPFLLLSVWSSGLSLPVSLVFLFPSLGLCRVCRQSPTRCDWAPRQASRLSHPRARPMATSTTRWARSVSSRPRPETSPWARPSTTHCWYCSTYHLPRHKCTNHTHTHSHKHTHSYLVCQRIYQRIHYCGCLSESTYSAHEMWSISGRQI